jgi:hypothetical protein
MLTDVLRQVVIASIPSHCKERLTRNVLFYYGNKRICVIWPAAVKGGGIKSGVLFGFCQAYRLQDPEHYLEHGTNKQIFYRIFHDPAEIDIRALKRLLREAIRFDENLGCCYSGKPIRFNKR